jgi:hypothetical protein
VIGQIAAQRNHWDTLEHFRKHFCLALGGEYIGSSSESWASTDLWRDMEIACKVPPLFLVAFYEAIEALRNEANLDLPPVELINEICLENDIPFAIHPPNLIDLRRSAPAPRSDPPARPIASVSQAELSTAALPVTFDVAISVAGPERHLAERLATILRDAGVSVFYDVFYKAHLWGTNLVDTLDDIYRNRSKFCVVFISKSYAEREWTNHERQSAQARALLSKGRAYILPIHVDGTVLPGLPPSISYMSLETHSIEEIAHLLLLKIRVAT